MTLRRHLCLAGLAWMMAAALSASSATAAEPIVRSAVLKSKDSAAIQPVSRRYVRPYYSYGYRTTYYRPYYGSYYRPYVSYRPEAYSSLYYTSGPAAYSLYLGPGFGAIGTYAYPPALQFSYPYVPYYGNYGGGYYYGAAGYYRPYWGYNPFYGATAYGYYYW